MLLLQVGLIGGGESGGECVVVRLDCRAVGFGLAMLKLCCEGRDVVVRFSRKTS